MGPKDLEIGNLNLTKRDFTKNFDLEKIFSNHFFFYNVNSYDLYFVGIRGFEQKRDILNNIPQKLEILFKRKKLRKILTYIYTFIIGENLRQNIFFFKKKLMNKFKKKTIP